MADALPIAALPFDDSGNTCGFADDYLAECPYPGSTAPDLVYRYVPAGRNSYRPPVPFGNRNQ
jgi:hypothetical protein